MAARKAQFSHDEIIETAFEMVRKNGWNGMTVPAVAKTIKSSTMPIYSHFKNVGELEDAIYLKAVDFMLEYMSESRTDDKWLDHAVGLVDFAAKEKPLFRCIFDGRNPELQTKALREWNLLLIEQLSDYPLFKGLSDEQVQTIRYARFMLVHGMASGINHGWHAYKDGAQLEQFLRKTTKALFDGLKAQFAAEKQDGQ